MSARKFLQPPFENGAEITACINEYDKEIAGFFDTRVDTLKYLVALSAQGSIFRAFRGCERYTPSSLYRRWAMEKFSEGIAFCEVQETHADFEEFHAALCKSLGDYWITHDGTRCSYSNIRKLIDVLLRHLVLWTGLTDAARKWLLSHSHIPLDIYTLHYIRVIASRNGIYIPEGASMGFANKHNYGPIQECIRECLGDCPPLYFDVIAWNREHENIIQQQLDDMTTPEVIARKAGLIPDNLQLR